ncbi:MAG: pseudouridine-5-phosphate glycosidase [Bdellovibrionales bacterium RIFOXYB1_FULL_37_110]|nr:MAG: pseudouridine-5-phosphate glycosidase [Bdellovibrionales bacterium RIFOXYC1_FULL_37_79]OFZ57789.1 MAG: pseudouridine-5-phosphate glycosidase [Bdellovibrionales bacterium RIFOXYB1_FULL_37_110]OFZ62755.1 MAG: pseudouridine-5-phosphate glycosidase [Bdellovibrionales bacterium RIFOXYD1_FULL_36_51]
MRAAKIYYSNEVKMAIGQRLPIVALESTIIAHGLPKPQNHLLAKELEDIVRSYGAVPATIAIIKGEIKVGLEKDELEYIALSNEVFKATSGDIAYTMLRKQSAATTVSSTMFIANLAGIKTFVTGGIGGVHLGVTETFDISRDLEQLAMTKMIVICAGAKSILDLPKTIEYLETKGVLVMGYGSDDFPAFYSSASGVKIKQVLNHPEEIAEIAKIHWSLGATESVLVCNPIEKEYEIELNELRPVIAELVEEARIQKISGKELTPFLLKRLRDKTNQRSLIANIALIKSNVHLGANVAIYLKK